MKTIINASQKTNRLSQLEKEVLHMMAYDYSCEEMMLELNTSREIINRTQSALREKLKVEHTGGLMRTAYEKKILVLDD